MTSSPASAWGWGKIERACNSFELKSPSRGMCSCMQKVANRELSRRDRARVASFFEAPQLSQDAKMYDKPFWRRYKAFASRSERSCRRYR